MNIYIHLWFMGRLDDANTEADVSSAVTARKSLRVKHITSHGCTFIRLFLPASDVITSTDSESRRPSSLDANEEASDSVTIPLLR